MADSPPLDGREQPGWAFWPWPRGEGLRSADSSFTIRVLPPGEAAFGGREPTSPGSTRDSTCWEGLRTGGLRTPASSPPNGAVCWAPSPARTDHPPGRRVQPGPQPPCPTPGSQLPAPAPTAGVGQRAPAPRQVRAPLVQTAVGQTEQHPRQAGPARPTSRSLQNPETVNSPASNAASTFENFKSTGQAKAQGGMRQALWPTQGPQVTQPLRADVEPASVSPVGQTSLLPG